MIFCPLFKQLACGQNGNYVNPPHPPINIISLVGLRAFTEKTKKLLPKLPKMKKGTIQSEFKHLLGNFLYYLKLPKLPKGGLLKIQVGRILPLKISLFAINFPDFFGLGK